jgi:hypothetical protein
MRGASSSQASLRRTSTGTINEFAGILCTHFLRVIELQKPLVSARQWPPTIVMLSHLASRPVTEELRPNPTIPPGLNLVRQARRRALLNTLLPRTEARQAALAATG